MAAFLRDLAASGGEWATLALSTARSIAVGRPPDRGMALGVVLSAAVGADADLRSAPGAFPLVVNASWSGEVSLHAHGLPGNRGQYLNVANRSTATLLTVKQLVVSEAS